MLYLIYSTDKEIGGEARKKARQAHLDYLEAHADKLVLAGATLEEDGTRTGSCYVINVGSLAEAEAFAKNEPFWTEGVFGEQTVTRMRRGQWSPENAPKTPEGN